MFAAGCYDASMLLVVCLQAWWCGVRFGLARFLVCACLGCGCVGFVASCGFGAFAVGFNCGFGRFPGCFGSVWGWYNTVL